MPTASANGIHINYSDTGGDAPAVVFSHGYLMDQSMFDAQVPALSQSYRVIAWDERAHGGTLAPGPFSFWDSAWDVLGLLDHVGVERAVLAGHSQGGFLSQRAALLAPERVRALILIDSQAGTEDPAAVPIYEQMHQTWLEQGPAPVQEIVASIILGPGQWDDWYAKWAAIENDQVSRGFRCLMDRDDLTDRLGEISCPALVLHGTEDAGIPIARAEALRGGLAGPVTFTLIDGGTHAPTVTHPEPVNAAILNFLSTLSDEKAATR